MVSKLIKKYLLLAIGTLSLVLGAIGIFIPLLPTTPLVVLSAYCYLRSSKKRYDWLINHRVFGAYIYNYLTYRAVKRSTKMVALIFLWTSLGISIFVIQKLYLQIMLVLIGIGVSIHLLKLATLPPKAEQKD